MKLRVSRVVVATAIALVVIACDTVPVTPGLPAGDPPAAPRVVGLVEVTITGIGTPAQAAVATRPVFPEGKIGPGGLLFSFSGPATSGGAGDGTIQFKLVTTGSFTQGERGAGGTRYVYATFKVRNAQLNGVAYDTERNNLTFLAVATADTRDETPLSRADRFDGTPVAFGVAQQLRPAGALAPDMLTGAVTPGGPDVLQVLSESEVAAIAPPPGVVTVFPYGFVVRNPSEFDTRTLPASPATDVFDGALTIAYVVPLQLTPAEDPYTISLMFLAMDDDEVKLTQALEEQTAEGLAAFRQRATDLRILELGVPAPMQTFLANGPFRGADDERIICSVRTAGTSAAPLAGIDSPTFVSFSPNPYAADGAFIDPVSALVAQLSDPITPTPFNMVVNASESGRHFLDGAYGGAGTTTVTTPTGSFRAGEEVEVSFARPLLCQPHVARFRVRTAATAGAVSFDAPAYTAFEEELWHIATGDVNGDGDLDAVVVADKLVHVMLGDGLGGFAVTPTTLEAGDIALGDFNGDGSLDLVRVSTGADIALGDGAGGFASSGPAFPVDEPDELRSSVVTGDINGDGLLDAVRGYWGGFPLPVAGHVALVGDGAGGLVSQPVALGTTDVSLGDLSQDGKLDVVSPGMSEVVTMLGNGAGGFWNRRSRSLTTLALAPGSPAIGDLNGDGRLDVAVANFDTDNISVTMGDATGQVGSPTHYAVGDGPVSLVAGDVDGDGHFDLAVANRLSSTVTILINNENRTGTFTAASPVAVAATPREIVLGDFNNDGRLDIVTVGSSLGTGQTFTIRLNNTAP